VTRSDQPKPPAVAIVRQNGLSSDSCRASVAVTPVSRQIWWIQVVGGRPLARLHSCEGRSPSLALVQIRRIWFAGTSLRSLATWPNRPSLRLRTIYENLWKFNHNWNSDIVHPKMRNRGAILLQYTVTLSQNITIQDGSKSDTHFVFEFSLLLDALLQLLFTRILLS